MIKLCNVFDTTISACPMQPSSRSLSGMWISSSKTSLSMHAIPTPIVGDTAAAAAATEANAPGNIDATSELRREAGRERGSCDSEAVDVLRVAGADPRRAKGSGIGFSNSICKTEWVNPTVLDSANTRSTQQLGNRALDPMPVSGDARPRPPGPEKAAAPDSALALDRSEAGLLFPDAEIGALGSVSAPMASRAGLAGRDWAAEAEDRAAAVAASADGCTRTSGDQSSQPMAPLIQPSMDDSIRARIP